MKQLDVVKFKAPMDPGDDRLLMVVLWVDRERAMVEALVGLPINPTRVVATTDIEVVPLKAFTVDGSRETFNGYRYGTWNGWDAVLMPVLESSRLSASFDTDTGDCKPMGFGLLDMSGFCLLEVEGCAC
jgi:hypothetical protein